MKRLLSLKYTFDHLAALVAAIGVVQTFVIGRHYLIPTAILVLAVLFGNLARYGYRDQAWAKVVLFWVGVILSFHVFFALFWSVKYRGHPGRRIRIPVRAADRRACISPLAIRKTE